MASRSFFAITLFAWLCASVAAQTQHFYSNPFIAPPTLAIDTHNPALAFNAPVFFTPFQTSQPGPLIFDSNGTLIWDGAGLAGALNVHDMTVCNFQGSPHLCMVAGAQFNGFARGTGFILDNTYTQVKTVRSGNGEPDLDQHEFKLINGGRTVLSTIYKQVPFDTSKFGIPGVSFVTTGIFQEIDLASGKVNFEWSSIDHVPVNESQVLPASTDISGDGKTSNTAWDYFHINSVDKTCSGDYIVSARHVKTIYKISGKDGSVLWRLGGKASSFTMDYQFNFQHDARVRAESGTTYTPLTSNSTNSTHHSPTNSTGTMVLSLYDNGSDDSPPPAGSSKPGYEPHSSGLVVSINERTHASHLLESYNWPNASTLSTSQGSLSFLPNGNRLMGAGELPLTVEITPNATGSAQVVFAAHLSYDGGKSAASYRDFKFRWHATPATPPDLFTYARNCSTATVMYASWNGATEVAKWRFKTSNSTANGTFHQVGKSVRKEGFETKFVLKDEAFAAWTVVEALDRRERVLGRSKAVKTFVPGVGVSGCGDEGCGTGVNYTTAASVSCGGLKR